MNDIVCPKCNHIHIGHSVRVGGSKYECGNKVGEFVICGCTGPERMDYWT